MTKNKLTRCFPTLVAALLAAISFLPCSDLSAQVKVDTVGPKVSRLHPNGVKKRRAVLSSRPAPSSNAAPYNARYIIRDGMQVAYSVTINTHSAMGKTKWVGVLVMKSQKPTPMSGNESHGFGTVDSLGILQSFAESNGTWQRTPENDIHVPSQMNFSSVSVTGYKIEQGIDKLPFNAHQHLRLMEAIFPKIDYRECNDSTDITESYNLHKTMNGMWAGMEGIQGKGTATSFKKGTKASRTRAVTIKDNQGNLLRKYDRRQKAEFDPRTQMMKSSNTLFTITEQTTSMINVEVKQIGFDAALKILAKQ